MEQTGRMTADVEAFSTLVKAFRDFEKRYAKERHNVSFEEKSKECILMIADMLLDDYRTIQDDNLKAFQHGLLTEFFNVLYHAALSFGIVLPNEYENGRILDADE